MQSRFRTKGLGKYIHLGDLGNEEETQGIAERPSDSWSMGLKDWPGGGANTKDNISYDSIYSIFRSIPNQSTVKEIRNVVSSGGWVG